jgi:hypothetical protein
MGVLLTLIAGLVIWVVTWAIGFKSFDGFLIGMLLVLLAAATRLVIPFLPGGRPRSER